MDKVKSMQTTRALGPNFNSTVDDLVPTGVCESIDYGINYYGSCCQCCTDHYLVDLLKVVIDSAGKDEEDVDVARKFKKAVELLYGPKED